MLMHPDVLQTTVMDLLSTIHNITASKQGLYTTNPEVGLNV